MDNTLTEEQEVVQLLVALGQAKALGIVNSGSAFITVKYIIQMANSLKVKPLLYTIVLYTLVHKEKLTRGSRSDHIRYRGPCPSPGSGPGPDPVPGPSRSFLDFGAEKKLRAAGATSETR